MASSEKRLTREQIATAMAKACHDEPCYPVQNVMTLKAVFGG